MTAETHPNNILLRRNWSAGDLLWLAVLCIAALAIAWEAWSDLFATARKDEESSHILLVPIVAAWLAWVRRARLKHLLLYGRWAGPLIVMAGGVLFVVGDQFLWAALWHAGAILLLVGAVVSVFGLDLVRRFFPVFLVLLFLIPVPGRLRQSIAIPLQEATAQVTTELCSVVGMDVERTGNLIRINGVDVAVGEACNGMRMMFALLLVCYTFAFITELRPLARMLIIALSPFSALLCNVLRLIPTVLVYGTYDSDAAQQFHDVAGWVMLFVAFALLLSIIRVLRWLYIPVSPFRFAHD